MCTQWDDQHLSQGPQNTYYLGEKEIVEEVKDKGKNNGARTELNQVDKMYQNWQKETYSYKLGKNQHCNGCGKLMHSE